MNRPHGTWSIAVVLVLLVVVWQVYLWVSHTPSYVLPDPWQTLQAVGDNLSLLASRSLVTLEGAVLGLVASVILAVALALVIVRWPIAEHVILTYALFVRTLPIVGVAPIITLLTGRGLATSVLCVMVITVFSLLISTIQGFGTIPPEISELSDLYAAPFGRRFRIALLPSATASLLQGLRVAAPLAVLGSLLAEWLDGFAGVGSLMITANADQEVQLLMAASLTAVALSLVCYALVEVATVIAARRGYRVDHIGLGAGT
jgi:ABC-type nitrate/sulfonate/bicarbonate transport system permease component